MLYYLHYDILVLAGWVGAYSFQGILVKSSRSAFNHHHHRCLHTLYRSSVNSMTSYGCACGFTTVICRYDFNRIRVCTIFFATVIHVVAYTFFEAESITTWTPWRFPPGRKREQRTSGEEEIALGVVTMYDMLFYADDGEAISQSPE